MKTYLVWREFGKYHETISFEESPNALSPRCDAEPSNSRELRLRSSSHNKMDGSLKHGYGSEGLLNALFGYGLVNRCSFSLSAPNFPQNNGSGSRGVSIWILGDSGYRGVLKGSIWLIRLEGGGCV